MGNSSTPLRFDCQNDAKRLKNMKFRQKKIARALYVWYTAVRMGFHTN